MLSVIFEKLDDWVNEQNIEARKESFLPISACTFRVVGQTALLEAKLNLAIAATADVDAYNDAAFSVISKFSELLRMEGLEYDPLSNEIWMPPETTYEDLFRGKWVVAQVARPEYVILSKAKMAPVKNRVLLLDYVASEPDEFFFDLCKKHQVDLAKILEDEHESS
jgi:hypothetical protein